MVWKTRENSQRLTEPASVHGYVERACFTTGRPELVGTELEWLVARADDPSAPVPLDRLREVLTAAAPFPGASALTFEPGGQVELSSPAAAGINAACRQLQADVDHLRSVLAADDLVLLPTAIDPCRPPVRQLHSPRYDAMERYFDSLGSETGRVMMTSTIAVQVNLDAGWDHADQARRWRLLHAVGPVLVAAFANSPVHAGRVTGWKSSRQRVWQQLDRTRTAPPVGADPVSAWSEYALDAPVMLSRPDACGEPAQRAPIGLSFRDWVTGRAGVAAPTEDDLAYHLTTLFPPVRPRGWFEVRYLDAQPPELWPVPVAVLWALTMDTQAADTAMEATAAVDGHWRAAARGGLEHRDLARAAAACFEAAVGALPRVGADAGLVRLVEQFVEQYVARGRCPADDPLRLPPATPERSGVPASVGEPA